MKISLKDKFINFKDMLKKLFEKYPVTLTLIYVVSFFFAILLDTGFMSEEWVQKLFMFGTIWGIGTFFAENVCEKGKKRISLYVLTAVTSYVFIHFAFINKYEDILIKWLVCYIVTMCAMSLHSIIKKSEKEFSEYVLKVSINIAKSSFVYGILAIGVAAILGIFDVLILNITSQYIGNIEVLIAGFFYSTKIIYSLINLDDDVNKFFKNLIKYVLMPLLIVAFAIIYMYILKILILRNMPQNTIFRIATSLFIVGGFIWTVMNYYKEEGTIYKISTKLPIIFSPFILLQIYTIGVRIAKNGITPLRYAGIIFIIFEICYILCYMLKNKKIQNLILVANALLIVSILIPGINAFDVSDFSQIKNLKIYTQKTELTEEDKVKISGAYYYLQDTEKGKNYIKDNLNKEQINDIKSLKTSTSYIDRYNYEYINLENNNKLNVSGYNTVTKIEASSYDEENIKKAFSDVKFNDNENKNILKVDLTEKFNEYINTYIENGKDGLKEFFKTNNEIQVNENQKIIFENIYFSIDNLEENISHYGIEAYLLEK